MALHSRLFPKAISFIKANYKPGERVRILELKSGLKIGYARTARLVEEMEELGIISQGNINWDEIAKF